MFTLSGFTHQKKISLLQSFLKPKPECDILFSQQEEDKKKTNVAKKTEVHQHQDDDTDDSEIDHLDHLDDLTKTRDEDHEEEDSSESSR